MSDDAGTEGARTLPRLVLAIGGLAATMTIVALVVMLSFATRQRDEALRWQERSYEAMSLVRNVDAMMARSEATLGRFVISGDKSVGRLYFDEWRRAGQLLDRLEASLRDDAGQARAIKRLRAAYAVRGEELSATALRTNYEQNSEALATYYKIGTAPSLAVIDAALDGIVETEREVLRQRSLTADRTIRQSNRLSSLVSVLGMVLVVGGGLLGWTVVRGAAQRRNEERRNQDLEDAVADRTAALQFEMTTREAAEDRLRQAQKMDAIGQLTGGIAHDFNNMLAVVISGIELARRRLAGGGGEADRHLDNAMEGATRAAALTRRLLAFARAEPLQPDPVDPDALVAGMSELMDRTLGDRISVRIVARAHGWGVFVDRQQLENALLNLAVNARDAMEEGGTLTISTARVTLAVGEVSGTEPGDYLRLSVSDTGTGMDRAVLDRVFEPFFTTKPVGRGTGLGLSQIFGFVRQSNGGVAVDSIVGTGTTVSLYLPRHDLAVEDSVVAPPAMQAAGCAEGLKLLVVEDDARVLTATIDALEELGHTPVPCAVAADAAALLDRHGDIALIISDVLMPGITGPELVRQLHRRRPDLPVLFVTGYSGDIDATHGFDHHPVLRKPFTIAALSQAIDSVVALPAAQAA